MSFENVVRSVHMLFVFNFCFYIYWLLVLKEWIYQWKDGARERKKTSLRVIEWSATNICYLMRFYPFPHLSNGSKRLFSQFYVVANTKKATGQWLHHEKCFFKFSSHFTHPILFCFTFSLPLRNEAEPWLLELTEKELTFRCHSTLLVVIESKMPMKSENQNLG